MIVMFMITNLNIELHAHRLHTHSPESMPYVCYLKVQYSTRTMTTCELRLHDCYLMKVVCLQEHHIQKYNMFAKQKSQKPQQPLVVSVLNRK